MKSIKELIANAESRGLKPILHHKPMNRRDLVSQGFIAGAGVMVTPSVLSYAADATCGGGGADLSLYQQHMIYGAMELPGGASITKYFYPQGLNGAALPSGGLNNLAVTRTAGTVDTTSFGIPLWQDHAFFLGLWLGTTPEVRTRMNGFAVASRSADDNAGNMHVGTEQLIKAGVSGALAKSFGTSETKNGARSMTPSTWAGSDAATVVRSPTEARGLMEAVSLSRQLPGRGAAIVAAARKMSDSRLASFSAKSLPQQIRDLIHCNYIGAEAIAGTNQADTVDYTKDTALLADLARSEDGAQNGTPPGRTAATPTPNPLIYNVQALTVGDTQAMMSQMYLALTGNGNILNLVLSGGYDYHQQDVAQNNQKDFNAGLLAGRYFSAAHYYNKARGIQRAVGLTIVTDGAAGGLNGTLSPSNAVLGDGDQSAGGDRGEGSGAFCLFYTPGPRLTLLNNNISQINYYTNGGGIGNTGAHAKVLDSPEAKIQAMLMNLIHIDGKVELAKAFPEPLGDEFLLFPKWRG